MTVPATDNEISMNIVGAVRNGGSALKETIHRIEDLSKRLGQHSVIIATNDNTDDTDQILSEYKERCAEVQVIRLDGMISGISERVERITAARNSILESLEKSSFDNTLTLMLDLDGPNVRLNPEAVLAAAKRSEFSWDAVFANSTPAYYDLYALRCQGWCEEDVWQQIHNARKPLFGKRKWRRSLLKTMIHDRQFHIPADCGLIPVDSAFAGAGLYKTQALHGLRYKCRDEENRLVCEHVLFHQEMRSRGARLYIDPALTTTAPQEHLGEGSGAPFPSNIQTLSSGAT
ncbi:hypothetical protein [Ruegeria atlantica]|uniref:hypothetical protein n=1 Tax=Ruegeria atlantica TaxID=81569 RepID=UPI00147FF4DB|nr:hypothetical protein [Ruegeria atlantica]